MIDGGVRSGMAGTWRPDRQCQSEAQRLRWTPRRWAEVTWAEVEMDRLMFAATGDRDGDIRALRRLHCEPTQRETAERIEMRAAVGRALTRLTPREEFVLKARFGLFPAGFGSIEQSLGEIGQVLGRSRERIRQTEAKALRKLAHPSHGLAQHTEEKA